MLSVDTLIEVCRRNGLRITPQRRAIVKLLAEDESHPTAEELYQRIVPVMPDISRTTIYSTLRELVTVGELTMVKGLGGGEVRYDTNSRDHDHLFCTQCHTLVDIHQDPNVEELPTAASGYRILRRQVTFYGICPECQARVQTDTLGPIAE
jgi:Fur family transcriptional regulator, peroxide stress response regulator